MTNEKRLETVLRAIRANWNDVDGLTVDEALKNPAKWIECNFTHAGNRALLELYADALESLEKQKTGTGTLSVLKRIVKDGADRFNGASEWNGLYYLCDGSRAFILNRKPDNIPAHDPKRFPDFGESVSNLIEKLVAELPNETECPAISDVKKHIAEWKANHTGRASKSSGGIHFKVPGTETYVNAEFLLDALTLIPNGTIHFGNKPLCAIYITSNETEGIAAAALIMPVKHREETETKESA